MKRVVLLLCLWGGVFCGDVVMASSSSEDSSQRKLDQTATWAVASVCAVIIIISLLLEKSLHKTGTVMVLNFLFRVVVFNDAF